RVPLFSFSSRRRHTRSKRDWSSDVCSSDLVGSFFFVAASFQLAGEPRQVCKLKTCRHENPFTVSLRPTASSARGTACPPGRGSRDRKSTRLNSSHVSISYAVFCLKKKRRVS